MKTVKVLLMVAMSVALSPTIASACPPGLAKKNPPCVPPGQAKKGVTTREWLNRGDRIDDDFVRIERPRQYDLPRIGEDEGYYRDGRFVYRVDEDTRRVLEWVEMTTEVFGN